MAPRGLKEITMTGKREVAANAGFDLPARRWPASWSGAIALMVVYLLPLAGHLIPGESLAAQTGREAVYWALTALLVSYIVLVERRPLSSVGWRAPTWQSFAFGLAAAAVMIAGMACIYLVLFPALGLSPNEGGLTAILATPLWFRASVVLRAAVFEELFFRGFMIERLTEITGTRSVAAIISLLAFTFAHLSYWGWAHLLIAGFGGAVLTGLYLLRRDLSCNMFAHLLTDAVGLVAG